MALAIVVAHVLLRLLPTRRARDALFAPLPTQLTIEVTTVCNITPPCVMCGKHIYPEQGWLNRDAAHFPRKYLPKLARVFPGLHGLTLQGIGEPLACPFLFDLVRSAPSTCHVRLTSNGWLLHETNRRRLIEARVAQIDVSLDASSPERYRRIRRGDLEETMDKVARLVAERDRVGATWPNVILNMCLMRENIDDLPGFVRLARRIGANLCYAFHLNQGLAWKTGWFDYAAQHCALEPERHDQRVAEAFTVAHELGMPFEMKGRAFFKQPIPCPAPIAPDMPTPAPAGATADRNVACSLPWQHAIVYRNGSVTNCCWQNGSLGSLEHSTFEEIWHGALQRSVRRHLLDGSFHPACLGKSICPPRGRP